MPFNQKPQTFNAKINEVTIGSGEKAIKIGGENVFPLYSFDAPIEKICQFVRLCSAPS